MHRRVPITWAVKYQDKEWPVSVDRVTHPDEIEPILIAWRAQAKSSGRLIPSLVFDALHKWDWTAFVGGGSDVFVMRAADSRALLCMVAVTYGERMSTLEFALSIDGILKCPSLVFRFRRQRRHGLPGALKGIGETQSTHCAWTSREEGTEGRTMAPKVRNMGFRDTLAALGFEEVSSKYDQDGVLIESHLELSEAGAARLIEAWED